MDIYAIRKRNLEALAGNRKRKECAEKWGTSSSVLSQILSKNPVRNLGDELARRIEAAEDLPKGYLDNVRDTSIVATEELGTQYSGLKDLNLWDGSTPVEDDEVCVPFLREVELAAGSGRFVIEESENAFLRFGKRSLRQNGVQFSQAKCVTVRGNSMLPVLRDGATVGVNIGKNSIGDITDGDLYAINHNGQLRVKQVYRLPSGIRLRSFNRDEHPDEDYTFQGIQEEQIAILGHVFWWGMYAR
ncbi:phage repressor protein C with HTH and peptisase S24 domain [Pseudomonas sp. GGS8]|uniref:S24 family peptidase n=1 Tax=Pseudomonas sp. GGS8 TaxID=2817892 RepID=UPI0034613FA4|nr:phage repressor protein C with HTH and peptisase S24 domain [Pseudomonas sp. GGS8]